MGGDVTYQPGLPGARFIVSVPAAEAPPSRVEGAHVPLRLLHEFPLEHGGHPGALRD